MKAKITFLFLFFISFLQAQTVSIPDSYFKNELIYSTPANGVAKNVSGVSIAVDANHNNEIEVSEALAVYELRLANDTYWNNGINSLQGLQSFTNLKYFENRSSSLNSTVSFVGLTNLEYIDLYGNYQIGTNGINLSGLTNLKTLNCSLCNLSAIDLTGLTGLVTIDLSNNHLAAVNFTSLPLIKSLDVHLNNLSVINVDGTNVIENLDVSGNLLTSFNSPLFQHLKYLSCGGNYNLSGLNLQNYTELIKLTTTNLVHSSNANFYNLTGCTNLQEFYCNDNNYLTGINLQGLTSLRIVQLKSSKLTNVNFSNLQNLEEIDIAFTPSSGSLSVNVQGCTNLKKFNANSSHLTSLNVSNLIHLETINCDSCTLLNNVNLTNCNSLKYADFSSSQLNTLDCSDSPDLLELDCNYCQLTNINLQNCSLLKKINCSQNPNLTALDLSCSNSYTDISFDHCPLLSQVNLKNGFQDHPVFSVAFTPNLAVIGVDYNETFTAFPATVSQTPYLTFTPNCSYNTLTGNVKYDIEGNGCQDNPGVENFKLQYTTPNLPQPSYTYTNQQGDFILYTRDNSVDLTPLNNNINPFWSFDVAAPINFIFAPTVDLLNINLCLSPIGIHHDLEVTLVPVSVARPGFDAKYKLIFKNNGTVAQSGSVNVLFNDAILDFVSSSPLLSNQVPNNLSWDFTNLLPFEAREIVFTLNINSPLEIPAVNNGTILNYTASITNDADETPIDNTSILKQTVVGSYDPNDKTCLEGANIAPSAVGEYVHYLIRFENTGTYPAENIVVRDVIDTAKFDITSLYPIDASHAVYSRITDNNNVEFIFENINLPFDDANNDGYVIFKIKTKATLTAGDTFSNSARIYFDYNAPIQTNTYISTIQTLGVNQFELENRMSVYPNPVKDNLFFQTKENVIKIEVYDITGRILKSMAVNGNKINLNELKTGNYIVKVYTENGIANTKITKE